MSNRHAMPQPAPAPGCRITVCIPARDERALIGQTLAALAAQRGIDGRPLPRGFFDVLVLANTCMDDTADVVRSIAARTPHVAIFTIEETFGRGQAHIGTARKRILDIAAARFLAAGKPRGVIASIDSDTIADDAWIASIAREMEGRDAVAGHVTIAAADQERLLAPVRLLYARELAYRRTLAEVESLIDPRPEDPFPRHCSFVGASFAVSAHAYVAAGGLPPLPRLEDLAFSRALRRIDARIRFSPLVRATTSARLAPRVEGGFGTFIAELHDRAGRRDSLLVEHPQRTLEDLESRAAVRRMWRGHERPADVARVADIFNLRPKRWLPFLDPALPFGLVCERITELAAAKRRNLPPAPVEFAIDTLRAAAAGAKSVHHAAEASDLLETLDAV